MFFQQPKTKATILNTCTIQPRFKAGSSKIMDRYFYQLSIHLAFRRPWFNLHLGWISISTANCAKKNKQKKIFTPLRHKTSVRSTYSQINFFSEQFVELCSLGCDLWCQLSTCLQVHGLQLRKLSLHRISALKHAPHYNVASFPGPIFGGAWERG